MPYSWTKSPTAQDADELHLWPHQSLPPQGFVFFIGATFLLLLMPLIPLLGTFVLWGLLPFLMAALAAIWLALNRSRRNAQVLEVLTLSGDRAHLIRRDPKGGIREWDCNRYWVRPELHETEGPVPKYVTLTGNGRRVEIGAFLSEDERVSLYDDLVRRLKG
jgi:uncharacterized membrane protein